MSPRIGADEGEGRRYRGDDQERHNDEHDTADRERERPEIETEKPALFMLSVGDVQGREDGLGALGRTPDGERQAEQ